MFENNPALDLTVRPAAMSMARSATLSRIGQLVEDHQQRPSRIQLASCLAASGDRMMQRLPFHGSKRRSKVLLRSCFVALDSVLLPEIFSWSVEQATDGPRKGLNPPPALC